MPIFDCTVFFRTVLPCSVGYHMERGGMPLHDAVGISCKNGATTENLGADVKYMSLGLYVDCQGKMTFYISFVNG